MRIALAGSATLEIFAFVSVLHREVVLRQHDAATQDIELTPDEADHVADRLKAAAADARAATTVSPQPAEPSAP